jgi:F-type H+-transporting ATPase subunit gamma
MFSRFSTPIRSQLNTTLNKTSSLLTQPQRYASDKAIKGRMGAVANIKKITRAMKMVASAKLKRSEVALNSTRVFAKGVTDFWNEFEVSVKEQPKVETAVVGLPAPAPANTSLVIVFTPDRGLCGSVSAQVSRNARNRLNALQQQQQQVTVITYGEKVRASLSRAFSDRFDANFTEHAKLKRRNFKQTCMFVDEIFSHNPENIEFITNHYDNMISFSTRNISILPYSAIAQHPGLWGEIELEGPYDILESFYQFSMALRVHEFLSETDMVEISQRVNSMGNSSKSAEEMLQKLGLLYNRSRQAKITTELTEIISGSVASELAEED